MLGGSDRCTLNLLPAETTGTGFGQGHAVSFIETLRVETAGAGPAIGGFASADLLWV